MNTLDRTERWLYALLVTSSLLCVACAALLGAPAPLPKPDRGARRVQPLIAPGRYTLEWGGTTYDTYLYPDGTMTHQLAGCPDSTRWEGTWQFKDGVLGFTESTDPTNPNGWMFWTVRLCPERKGTTEGSYGSIKVSLKRHP